LKNILIYLILLTLTLFSCTPDELEPMEYVRWVENENNGLKVSRQIGEFIFTVQYKPLEYKILQKLKDPGITYDRLEEEKKEIEDMQYFTFTVKVKDSNISPLKYNLENDNDYYGRLEYFSFHIQNDFRLIDGKDTLNCLLHHFERTYELTPENTFVLAFRAPQNKSPDEIFFEDKTFIYEDKILNTGKVNLIIKAENLNQIPNIKIL